MAQNESEQSLLRRRIENRLCDDPARRHCSGRAAAAWSAVYRSVTYRICDRDVFIVCSFAPPASRFLRNQESSLRPSPSTSDADSTHTHSPNPRFSD